MRKTITLFAGLLVTLMTNADAEKPYYYLIPEAPDAYTGPNVAARLVDGLGFRYFWATEGLRAEDLAWAPGEGRRTTGDTIDHIYNLVLITVNATRGETTESPVNIDGLSFEEKRATTLANIREASENLKRASEADMATFKLKLKSPRGYSEYPFWNDINGPISDAVWHCGQIVSFRRSSGNPLPAGTSFLRGERRE